MHMNEASYRERASVPIRSKGFWWTALALSLLLLAVLLGARSDSAPGLPVKAVRWFLGLDEADEFALPLHPTGSEVDP
jgi:hypothetical protein